MRKEPTHGAPRNNKLFLSFKYINLVKSRKQPVKKLIFNKFTSLKQEYFKTGKNLL